MESKSVFREFLQAVTLRMKIDQADDEWEYTQEPHVSRRREILKKYPQIKKLMGYDPTICVYVSIEVAVQIVMCYLLQNSSWLTIFVLAYCFGGVLNHSLGSAIHEIGHNLAFGHSRPLANRALSMFCNLPLGVPMAVSYKRYHTDHHRWLGHDTLDVDIPTVIESYLFRHPLTKIFWLMIHPLIHAVRPFIKSPKRISGLEIINFFVQLIFNAWILHMFGVKSLVYLVIGTLFALGFHPLAGHFISEHYLFDSQTTATISYYGPLNFILYNVGYHVEHHDFPYITYDKLPEVRRIAPEFYENLPYHTSWLKVLWDFVFKPYSGPQGRSVTMINRTKEAEALKNAEVLGNGTAKLTNGTHDTRNGFVESVLQHANDEKQKTL
ncbi:sphingolipid delta(4)-desaturase DES1-like [Tubulanus polymorphus]|uniref:sphingolipid delta(4)-desaturase DES1-like n=1 Tax=Tubulanus polymorphus TaxID=672921 RepID=UPI003DA422E3